MTKLLTVKNLTVHLTTKQKTVPVIDNLSFNLNKASTLSFVGESGCGKSITALAIMGLLPNNIATISKGEILFAGEDLTKAPSKRLQEIRGNEISMIFQEPMTSLNPLYTIGEQICETIIQHQKLPKKAATTQAIEWLAAVQLPKPKDTYFLYPHQLSGGQRQRVMIACALANQPKLLIADEPTTALDVTVQAQIFSLLENLTKQIGSALLLITHDMGIVKNHADKMLVMYGGQMIEMGLVKNVLTRPHHPYTKGLIACIPHLTFPLEKNIQPLQEINGIVPPLADFGKNCCSFAPRCYLAKNKCFYEKPHEVFINSNHASNHISKCFFANEIYKDTQ